MDRNNSSYNTSSRDRTADRSQTDHQSRLRIRSNSQIDLLDHDAHGSYLGGRTKPIQTASCLLFIVIGFGILFTLFIGAASIYLILPPSDGGGDDISHHGDISNIMLPLIVYILNVAECCLVYLEARHFRMRGYSLMFAEVSDRVRE